MAHYWPLYSHYRTTELCHKDVYSRLSRMRKALSELQLRNEQGKPERSSSVSCLVPTDEDEVEKLHEESERRIAEVMARYERQEEEVRQLRSENAELRSKLAKLLVCGQQVNGDLATEDEEIEENHLSGKSELSTPTKPVNNDQLLQRLQEAEERSRQAEQRADHMNLLFNQKLIELNKLQLSLSNQTKEMIKLEKAYFHVRYNNLSKGSKSPASRMSPAPRLSSSLSSS